MTGGLLIFSLPGSGGERLSGLLGAHPALGCFEEPFNPDVRDPTGRRVPRPTVAGVDAVLDGVWAEWPVIEHVWDPTGWPFHRHSALNGHVLLRAARVVLLSRRNLLALAVSATIAEQRRLRVDTGGSVAGTATMEPPDVARIEWMLSQIRSSMRTHRRVLYTRDRPFLDLMAETVFGMNATGAARLEALQEVFAFLGFRADDPGVDLDRIRRGLDPGSSGPDLAAPWRQLPNIDEIERRLGSDETGWLLRDAE